MRLVSGANVETIQKGELVLASRSLLSVSIDSETQDERFTVAGLR